MLPPLRLFLHPCGLAAHREPHEITTILGSCVAICLYDPVTRTGGMNHYMLPLWNGDGLPTPKFGNVALDHLRKRMRALGVPSERMVAKVFGGGNVIGEIGVKIGDRNAEIAMVLLEQAGIPVVAQDVGGARARKVIFNTGTGVALVAQLALDAARAQLLPEGRPGLADHLR